MSQFYHNASLIESERSKSRKISRVSRSQSQSIASMKSLGSHNGSIVKPTAVADLAFDEKLDTRNDEPKQYMHKTS